jgi:NAD(P)-dependent dehydrogenase (short-subunit alcohol dehydrogenase family)
MTTTARRHVLVTGGSGALGTATVRHLLDEGHAVASASRSAADGGGAQSLELSGDRFHALRADVKDPASVDDLVRETVARLGSIDVLVHLVGGWAGGIALHEHSVETWDRVLELNLRSAFLCTRATVPLMRAQGWGRIVLVSSVAARRERRGQAAYAVAKAAVGVLAESIAEENEDLDVTANVVAISALDTPANRASATIGRLVPIDDVAAMISFLASDAAGQLRGAWLPAFGHS